MACRRRCNCRSDYSLKSPALLPRSFPRVLLIYSRHRPPPNRNLAGINLDGTLPESIGAFVDVVDFKVENNNIRGTFPASAKAWTKLRDLEVWLNGLTGPLPALPYEKMSFCSLYFVPSPQEPPSPVDPRDNNFACPFPAGVVGKCLKSVMDSTTARPPVPVTAADCKTTCTGASTKLAQPQCNAWAIFYDALGGDDWKVADPTAPKYNQPVCQKMRTDPCSCFNNGASTISVCNEAGTAVTKM